MASLVRLTALRNARRYFQTPLVLSRGMSGAPHEGDPPTTTLGGPFKVPVYVEKRYFDVDFIKIFQWNRTRFTGGNLQLGEEGARRWVAKQGVSIPVVSLNF